MWSSTVQANPVGEQVVAGAAGFERVGGALTITQGTDRAVINWNSFSIGAGEITKFVQPNSSSAVLNRVITANNPSAIYGTLQANGQVYLINPAGVFIGPGGLVDTAGFVASTHDVDSKEFMAGGDLNFTGNSGASIVNQGRIEVKQGDVFLVARQVSNEGQIMASDGTVGMVSGTEVCLHSIGPNNYKVRLIDVANSAGVKKTDNGIADVVNAGVIEAANAELESTGNYLSLAIKNTGVIRATGVVPNADGTVTLTGGEGDILNTGVVAAIQKNIQGDTVGGRILASAKNITTDPGSIMTAAGQEKGGEVKIDAKDTIYASGKIEATSSEGAGGKIVMTGERVGLVKAEVDVSGATQGGTVLAGGGLSGADPEVRNAKALVMTPDSVIRANATKQGNGGEVILWSDEYTGFYGEIFARGGPLRGDGGFVETSSKGNLQALGQADVSAFRGRGGTWLIDPPDVYITTTEANIGTTFGANSVTFAPIAQNSQVSVDRILYALNNNQDVIIQAGPTTKTLFAGLGEVGNGNGDITVAVPIVADLNSTGSLTMNNNWIMSGTSGYGNIFINAKVVVGGNLTLAAGDDRGNPQLPDFPTRSDGGKGGSISVNAPLYANGLVSIAAGQSIATNSGGTGGSIEVNADIYAGSGLSLIGGDADKGWNTGTTGVPPTFLITPYLTQTPNGTGTGAAIRAEGGTAGTVTIQSGVTIYLGNGDSTIRAGTAGNNQLGGSLTLGSAIVAVGNNVNLTLASGLGTTSGTLSLASPLGTSGVQVDLQSIFGVNNAPTLTSSVLNSLTLKSGNQVTVSAPANATTIRLSPYNPENGMWIGQTDISDLSVFRIGTENGVNSLENLVGANLFIGTPDSLNPNVSPGGFYVSASYKITDLGSTTQNDWNTIAGTTGVAYVVGSFFTSVNSGTAGTTGTAKILTGDIGIGQSQPISFASSNVTLQGNASAISFSGNSGQPYSVSILSGGTMTFDNGGPLFSNFAGSTVDVYIPSGTVDFVNVQAPGNNPVAAPGTGTLFLDVANLRGAGIIGDSFIQILQTASSANSGQLNFSGNITATAGTVLNTAMTGSFNLTAPGSISQTAGILTIPGTSSFTSGGAITLGSANDFTGAVSLSTGSSGSATIQDANAITLGTLAVTGSLTATSTGALNLGQGTVGGVVTVLSNGNLISQSAALTVSGSGISGINAGAGNITLNNIGNDFIGPVNLVGATVTIVDQNNFTVGTSTVLSTLTVTAGGSILQNGTITGNDAAFTAGGASSDILLNSSPNLFLGAVTLSGPGGGGFRDLGFWDSGGAVTLPVINATRNVTIRFDNNDIAMVPVALTGNLVLMGEGITQTGPLNIDGTTTVTSTGGQNIDLATAAGNEFTGTVSLSGANVSLLNSVDLVLGASTATGNFDITSNGSISQTGAIGVTGTADFEVGGATDDILLASIANNFQGAVTMTSGTGTFQDLGLWNIAGASTLPVINATRSVTVRFDNSSLNMASVTLSGNLSLAATSVTQAGLLDITGATSVTASTGGIDLKSNGDNNDFKSVVTLSSAGDISVLDKSTLVLGDVTTGSGGFLDVETSAGSITQSGGTTISVGTGIGTVFEAAGAGAITLANQNDFRGTVTLTGGATEITDANALTLGALTTGAMTAISTGALNLGQGTVTGALSATSNGGPISQTGGLILGSSSIFNSGSGSVTLTAGLGGPAQNSFGGAVSMTAGNADFYMDSGVTGVDRLAQTAGSTVVTGTFTLRSPAGTDFNLASGVGVYKLTSAQLANMNVETLAARASGTGNLLVGTFDPAGVTGLNLITADTGNVTIGSIRTGTVSIQTAANSGNGNLSSGTITAGSLSLNLRGSASFTQPNQVENLGTLVVGSGGLNFQNQTGLNLTGAASMPGRLSLEVAGQFNNQTGVESPLAGVQLGSVIKSLSLMGGLPNSVSGLSGFSYRYDGVIPTSGNVMSYAVSPLTQFAPSGTTIAGVDLSGTQTGGGQFNTFLTGSDDLNWIISDFGKFNLPKVSSAGLEYTIYPQRVEPETRTLPDSTLSQLRKELGRPPTIEEINKREVSMRETGRLRSGSILERSSLDTFEESNEPQENAKNTTPSPAEGQVPQANQGPKKVVPTENSSSELVPPVASFQTNGEERGAVSELLVKERANAEVGLAIPVANTQ
ncbi:MAG: filamentous hemagglutinin N-terminal domain-containing protein [Candidatus Pacebacteria bacterium]|nr:filamentous hemagglutinin N-terminal domain-containing protein [Candidatus Paceibacterota bacterium]